MEDLYTIEILTADNRKIIERITALNDLKALDIAYEKHKDKKIVDIKVV